MLPGRRIALIVFALVAAFSLQGCGTSKPPVITTPPSATSAISCPGGTMPCSGSVEVPLIIVNGSDPGTFGLPMSCSLTAGAEAMKFIAAPSTPWFGVSPGSGTLQADTSTTIAVPSINASNVNARNIGLATVSASGYKDNSQMAVELNCNVAAGSCKVAFSCEPSKHPLP